MGNGLYRIAAYAVDYAVPNFDAYNAMNRLVDNIFSNPLDTAIWSAIAPYSLNDTTIYVEFRVDTAAPVFTFRETRAVTAADTVNYGTYVNLSGKYDALRKNAPARDSSWTYVSKDSLLQIGYTVRDSLNGRDSAAVTIGWNFVHLPDTNVIDRAGDSVWVFDSLGGSTSGAWTEMAGLRMADGEYSVRAILRDEAKNVRHDAVPKRVRVDRTAPQIVGLTSDHLVYMATDGDFSATILVSERGDVGVNRSGMHCSYRVLGGADTSWHEIRKGNRKLLSSDTVTFTIDKSAVDTSRGTRYLEAACVDAAGNVSVRTDIFHVGARFPQITYPLPDSIQSNLKFIPIVGIAPKMNSVDSLSSVYRLRYRIDNDTTWRTDKVRVVAANRSENVDYISRISQSTEGVLGYLENDGFGDEAKMTVELAIASCETCNDWAAVTTNFVVVQLGTNYSKPTVEFAVTRNGADVGTFKTGDGPVDISVRLKNKFNGNYMLRVYAEDSKHRGIFDASREKVFYNPYYGTPTAAADTAIWFYEMNGKYYLKWNNLDKVNLKVGYNSSKFGETCVGSAGSMDASDCSADRSLVDLSSILDVSKAYLSDYPEWMPPAYIDSTMTITKNSGEVVLESSEAFRVYVERKDATDTAALNIPVYFGESTKPGFYWVEHVDSLVSPLMTGWTVNPNAYGLDYRWDGIATSGAYPSGDITLYAEVTENILDNPFVNVVTKTLKVEQKEAELVVRDTLPDYIALKLVDSNKVSSVAVDSNKAAYMRDSMKVYFGLKNADARVKISVLDSNKKQLKILLDSTLRAHMGDSAYSVTWDGKDSLGNVQSVGEYYIKFESPSNTFVTKNVLFKMKLRNGMLDETPVNPMDPGQSGFYVAEAEKVADDIYRYEPFADYLVDVQMKGWYLPNSRRYDRFDVMGNVSGTQNILGFRPERFSLGIKRHRDTLDLFILVRVKFPYTVAVTDCADLSDILWQKCTFEYGSVEDFAFFEKRFTKDSLSIDSTFDINLAGRGIYNFYNTDIDVVACSRKKWASIFKGVGKKASETFENAMRECEWNMRNVFGGPDGNHKFLRDPGGCDDSVAFAVDYYRADSLENECDPREKDGYLESVCVYPKPEDSDDKYNPNRKLFDVVLIPDSTGKFFGNCQNVNGHKTFDRYWTRPFFNLRLTIPESYWNAPFGMDNLVNRTIRFDHTNQTIFNEKGKDGYWNSVVKDGNNGNPVNSGVKNYYDGSEWRFNPAYGLITPYEVQRLIFFPVDVYSDGSNVFRFDDEGIVKDTVAFGYSSSFELKFYGHDTTTHHFEAKVIGNLANPLDTSGCVVDSTKFVMRTGAQNPCQISVTSIGQKVKKTPVFTHGNVHFFVGMNRLWSEVDNGHRTSISYPADFATWKSAVKDLCKDTLGWASYKQIVEGKDSCYKYYGSGSRVHYYFNDYSDSLWKIHFLTDSSHYFRNYVNSPGEVFSPKSMDDVLAVVKKDLNGKDFVLSYFLNPDSSVPGRTESEPGRFFIHIGYLDSIRKAYNGSGVTIADIKVEMGKFDSSVVSFDKDSMNLYITAEPWTEHVLYRRTIDTSKAILERPNTRILPLRDIYTFRVDPLSNNCDKSLYCKIDTVPELLPNPWIKNAVVDTARLLQIDLTEHPVLEISGGRDSSDRIISFKDTVVARPPELVEIRGKNLTHNQVYTLSFLNDSTYYLISDTLKYDANCEKYPDGSCHLAWFNVNRLQGRTQFLLTWGGDSPTNAMHFNMYVGSNVEQNRAGVVKSMYGELSVTFPQGSIEKSEDFTVRTVNVQKDYGFNVFKNMALTGPVMEVLPSMTFKDTTKLPRIQMKISRQQMENMNVTPQTLRLYKVDFDKAEFVPLENALYGFLHADGSAVMNGTDTLMCRSGDYGDARCAGKNFSWDYVLISAETRTFSVFVAMDSLAASMQRTGLEVLPTIAKVPEREVRVYGIGDFNLYVDDDSLWNDEGDLTPMVPLAFTLDSNGSAHVTLPVRASGIDTNYVFAFAKVDSVEMFAPEVARALTVPAVFTCHVPSDSLWMGIDNGYLAYGASCSHPGYGTLLLYKESSLIAEIRGEIPDTIRFDGKKRVGGSVVGTIPQGRYETRYIGVSALDEDVQLAGPSVRTDAARPVISSFEISERADVLDRIFTVRANVRDLESGVARVSVSATLGNALIRNAPLLPTQLVPDSSGNVSVEIRLTRQELSLCNGCKLSLEMRAEDFGHNHTEKSYQSGSLLPYPQGIVLWYPSREGTGTVAYEYVANIHNLNLKPIASPWLSDEGIYLSNPDDYAVGNGLVSFNMLNEYSFEARIKNGNANKSGWFRVLGFNSDDGFDMELRVQGRKLQFSDGLNVWETAKDVLPPEKEWAHVVVTVDSTKVRFYVNGELVSDLISVPFVRDIEGGFSIGANNSNSFVGNVADIRMYRKALSSEEVFALSQPVSDVEEIVEIVTVPMVTVDGGDGFEPEFSCSVAGNRYFEASRGGAKLTMDVLVEKAGTYKVMMYVRSARLSSANVAVLPSSEMRYTGSVQLSPVWRTASVPEISMNLSAGLHTVTLEAPEGLQIAGFALVTDNVPASSIAWNSGMENSERTVKTFVRYEGFADKKVLQPRVRLKNISNSQIKGYSVRYYFRGEEASMARVHPYYPHDTIGLAVHSESARTGYVEWAFRDGKIPAGGTVFNGDGPHFGVHYEDWAQWNPYDDPSFVENAATSFVEDNGIIVLDADKRLIGGSCVEMEDSISAEVKARVYAVETRNDNMASEIQMKVENVGNITLKNYDVRYYFFLEGGLAPEFNAYNLPDGVTAAIENIGDGRWQVSLHASKPLVAGGSWKNLAHFVLHCENWNDIWNASDDPSRFGLGRSMVEAVGVNVFDSLGNRIYGNEPVWPEIIRAIPPSCDGCSSNPISVPDIGLEPKKDRIPVHRTDDGLVIEMAQYTNISLSLVNVNGIPVKSLYSGTLAPGQQFVRVDWSGIDLNKTYLMLRVNGSIKSTKLLSLL